MIYKSIFESVGGISKNSYFKKTIENQSKKKNWKDVARTLNYTSIFYVYEVKSQFP